jgi:uncharacterized protein (TIGR03067 family)
VASSSSLAAVLAQNAASACVSETLLHSTARAASLLAVVPGAVTAVISAKVAALTEGMVKAMFVNKIKGVLAVVLVFAALTGAVGLIYRSQAVAEQPLAKTQQIGKARDAAQPLAQPIPKPPKTDQERMVGNWFITNDDSGRKGEMWVITADTILMHAKNLGVNAVKYFHRVDAGKTPKQIDITVKKVNGQSVGVIKGIYVLDGDQLRLCLGGVDKDRPAAFPDKPKPGEVLMLHRAMLDGTPPKAKQEQPAKTDLELMAGLWTIVNGNHVHRDDGLGSKGQVWDIGTHQIVPDPFLLGKRSREYFHRLDSAKSPKQIDITVAAASSSVGTEIPIKANARILGVIKGIYELDRGEFRLCLGEMGKDRPAAFPKEPKQGEVLILQREAPDGASPKAKDAQPQRKVLTPEEAIKQIPKENVTVQFKVASVERTAPYFGYPSTFYICLKDGGKFTARLIVNEFTNIGDADQIKKLGIKAFEDLKGRIVRVTGRVEPDSGNSIRMFVRASLLSKS